MKKIVYLVVLAMIAGTLWAGDSNDDTQKIQQIMARQVHAWNQGNVDGFMAGYWKSDQFTFQSGNKRLKGWEQLQAMYKKNYAGEKMGKLEFSYIEMKNLTTDIILVMGRWKVTAKGESKEGLYTLIFRRFGKDWKIIHDHSS
ncbi:MAG: SgcJ/EcaC family oxidoreductase [bacterium]|nr:SgcJ/EcaC family oxidoreductase [bacterium]